MYTLGDLKDAVAVILFIVLLIYSYSLTSQAYLVVTRVFLVIAFLVDATFVGTLLNGMPLRVAIDKLF